MSEIDLVHRARGGDREAFGALVVRHQDSVRALAYHYLGDLDEALDVAQESFVRAFVGLPALREPARFGAWIRRIAVNECRRHVGRRSVHGRLSRGEIAAEPTVDSGVDRLLTRLAVGQALDRLPEPMRLTVVLRYLGGLAYREIADFLEVPVTTVKSRLRNAKARLREEMIEMVEDAFEGERTPESFAEETVRKALERGRRLKEQGRLAEARAEAERAWDVDPADPAVFRLLVETGSFSQGRPRIVESFEPRPLPEGVELTGDIRDVARRLRVSPVDVYGWIRRGMPCYLLDDGRIRFSLATSIAWLRDRGEEVLPRVPGWVSDDTLLAVLRSACRGDLSFEEAAEIVERFHTSELWMFIERGGRLSNIGEIAPLLPERAGALVEEVAGDYADFARLHIRLRETWSACEVFEAPGDRTGLWDALEGIADRAASIAEKLSALAALRPWRNGLTAPDADG